MSGRLAGKVAIVTGSGSSGPGWGNGKAIAVLFAREGAKVVGVDVDPAAAGETEELIAGEGGIATTVVADVTQGNDVERGERGPARRPKRTWKPTVWPTGSISVLAIRAATERAASRRGSSMRMR